MSSINDALSSYALENLYGCKGDVAVIGGGKPLKEMGVSELRDIAKGFGIPGRWSMKQAELVQAIRNKARAKQAPAKRQQKK